MAYYAVAVGRETGVFRTWEECEVHVKGFKNAKYKRFKTSAEADLFVSSIAVPRVSKKEGNMIPKRQVQVSSSRNHGDSLLRIYTDGSCIGNNKVHDRVCPAGFGVVVYKDLFLF